MRIISLFMLIYFSLCSGDHAILFVHLGDKIPPSLQIVIKQARFLNEASNIALLVDQKGYETLSSWESFFEKEKIFFVNMETVLKSKEHRRFIEISEKLSFFSHPSNLYPLERFFYLWDFVQDQDLQDVVHLENDCMLYVDLKELTGLGNALAVPFESQFAGIPSFVFIKDAKSLQPLIEYVLESVAVNGCSDMHVLASFYRNRGDGYLLPLPTLMPEYGSFHLKKKSAWAPDNVTPLKFLSKNEHLFPSCLFDAAALGVFIGGNDPSVFPDKGPGTLHFRSLFSPCHFQFFWGGDVLGRAVPYLSFQGKEYRIVNMHFHSKKVDGYTSYLMERENFP